MRPLARPRLLVVGVLAAGLLVPASVLPASATVRPCGQSFTKVMTPTFGVFPLHKVLPVYQAPSGPLRRVAKITDPMPNGTRGVLLGVGTAVTGTVGWMKVWYPNRSNRAVGWVKNQDALVSPNTYSLQLNRAQRKLAVVKGATGCFKVFPIAVGAVASPTPAGLFYVNDRIPAPNGAYGHHLLGTDAYSPTFRIFSGLDGVIGIHGTNEPSAIGHNVTHGCIRMFTADSDRLFPLIPVGTPIIIT